jgi:phenylpropionate dioxygenase-like ring-hydroxylating dioxygenase large terminal subunit
VSSGDTTPRALPGRAYTDPAVLTRELDTVFPRTWQLVGHVGQIPNDGDYLTATVGDQGVVVLRHAGHVRAMFNVCQHRGHELLTADAGHVHRITCPYHAWTYDRSGRLLRARGADVGPLCVPPVSVESLGGFLFVNLDPDATPLDDYVPGVADELAVLEPKSERRVLTWTNTAVVDANWKLAIENYNECYHCPNVHTTFTTGIVARASYRIASSGNCVRHTARATARTAYRRDTDDDVYSSFFVWPVSSIQCYPGRVLNTFRWVPLAVDRTLLIRQWWFEHAAITPEQQEIIDLDWDTTVAEDLQLLASVQRGMRSRGYRPGPLVLDPSGIADTNSEDPVLHLQHLVATAADDELSP